MVRSHGEEMAFYGAGKRAASEDGGVVKADAAARSRSTLVARLPRLRRSGGWFLIQSRYYRNKVDDGGVDGGKITQESAGLLLRQRSVSQDGALQEVGATADDHERTAQCMVTTGECGGAIVRGIWLR